MIRHVGIAPLDRPGEGAHFPDTATLRAAVMGSRVHDDTVRFDDPVRFVGNLLGCAFLHREAARIFAHDARKL